MKSFKSRFSKNTRITIVQLILSYLTMIGMGEVTGYGITGIEIMLPVVFVCCFLLYRYVTEHWNRLDIKYALPLGMLFSLSISLGSCMKVYDGIFYDFGWLKLFSFLILSVFFTGLILLVLHLSEKWTRCPVLVEECKSERRLRNSLIVLLLLLLCWLPYYLTLFPGNMGADTFESLQMIEGEIPWTNHHPVFFTFFIKIIVMLTGNSNLTLSMGVCTFVHMLLYACTIVYFLHFLYKKGMPVKLVFVSFLFFALHPFSAMYSMYLSKDVLFSCALLLLTMELYDLIETKGESLKTTGACIRLSVFSILTLLLRNNGLFIVIILAAVLSIRYRKNFLRILLVFGSAFLLFMIYKGPVFSALQIEKESFAEAASIPLQQVGYVIANDGEISDEDREFLEKLMPLDKVKQVYDPGYTDPYKFDEEFDDAFLNEHTGQFLTVWWHLCQNNFSDYVKAYLMQTAGYWHYGETNSVCTQGVVENVMGVQQFDVIEQLTGRSLSPLIEKLMLAARKAPLFCLLSSMGVEFFSLLFLALLFIKKHRGQLLLLLPLFVLWITVMIAAPAFCLFRYLYPLFMAWPLILFMIYQNLAHSEEKCE